MNISKLNRTISKFWNKHNRDTRYYLGYCSEVAIALKRFLKKGTIYKRGLMHTCLKVNGYYCDIRGCYPEREYQFKQPGEYLRPATAKERAHINKLLHEDIVRGVVKGLKEAS